MNNKFKKSILIMAFAMTLTFANTTNAAYAKDDNINDSIIKSDDSFYYDGNSETFLGEFETKNDDIVPLRDNYHEYDSYYVYDQGITKAWVWLSNPYFIKSVAKGATYEYSVTVSANITASITGNFPAAARGSILSTFGISGSNTKTVTVNVKLSGPDDNHRTRDFYYKKGRNRHKVKIVQKHSSNWDGVLWTKTYYAYVDVPAIYNYSVDR